MEIVLWIIGIAAAIGALIGFFGSGGEGESAAGGAAAGTAVALGCLWQVLIYGGMALLGIWLIGAIFG